MRGGEDVCDCVTVVKTITGMISCDNSFAVSVGNTWRTSESRISWGDQPPKAAGFSEAKLYLRAVQEQPGCSWRHARWEDGHEPWADAFNVTHVLQCQVLLLATFPCQMLGWSYMVSSGQSRRLRVVNKIPKCHRQRTQLNWFTAERLNLCWRKRKGEARLGYPSNCKAFTVAMGGFISDAAVEIVLFL